MRLRATRRHLGPAPGWFMRGKLDGAATHLGQTIESAKSYGGGVLLTSRGDDGRVVQVVADHVIAATGYRPDLRRLPFLESSLRAEIAQIEHTPHLIGSFRDLGARPLCDGSRWRPTPSVR